MTFVILTEGHTILVDASLDDVIVVKCSCGADFSVEKNDVSFSPEGSEQMSELLLLHISQPNEVTI